MDTVYSYRGAASRSIVRPFSRGLADPLTANHPPKIRPQLERLGDVAKDVRGCTCMRTRMHVRPSAAAVSVTIHSLGRPADPTDVQHARGGVVDRSAGRDGRVGKGPRADRRAGEQQPRGCPLGRPTRWYVPRHYHHHS
eukprot:3685342-Pyramimonas_sp.AAC.1